MADMQIQPLAGSGTFTATVLDNNGAPATVLDAGEDFTIHCEWEVDALAAFIGGEYSVAAYVEAIGPGEEKQVGNTETRPAQGVLDLTYEADILVPAGTLPDNLGPGGSGAYKLVTLLTHSFGAVTNVAAVDEERVLRIS
jgi:hypothetical protein